MRLDDALVIVLVAHQDGDARDAEAPGPGDAKRGVVDRPRRGVARRAIAERVEIGADELRYLGREILGQIEIALAVEEMALPVAAHGARPSRRSLRLRCWARSTMAAIGPGNGGAGAGLQAPFR